MAHSPKKVSSDRDRKISQQVRVAQETSLDAVRNHDRSAVEAMFSESFSTTGGDFQFESRDALVRAIDSGSYKYDSIKSKIRSIKLPKPDLAIVVDRRSVKATIKGERFSAEFDNTAVYAQEESGWRVLLWSVNC